MILPKDELNWYLVIITTVLSIIALLGLTYLYLRYKCGCCQSKHKASGVQKEIPQVRITVHNDKSPLADPEIDFIDSRNTNLVSSTVQVKSVHAPMPPSTSV